MHRKMRLRDLPTMWLLLILGAISTHALAADRIDFEEISFLLSPNAFIQDLSVLTPSLLSVPGVLRADTDNLEQALFLRFNPKKTTAGILLKAVQSLGLSAQIRDFHVRFSTPGETVRPKQKAQAELIVAVGVSDGYIHPQAPLKIQLTKTPQKQSFTLGKKELFRTDAGSSGNEEKAGTLQFLIPFSISEKGPHKLTANVEFYFCTPKVCQLKKAKAEMSISVK